MRLLRSLLDLVGHLLLSAVAVALVAGPPVLSWTFARLRLEEGERLRLYFVARERIVAGQALRESDFEPRLGRLRPGERVLHRKSLGGWYAVEQIAGGERVTREKAKPRHELQLPPAATVVPVRVGREYADVIRPGMRLAFVREETVESAETSKKVTHELGMPGRRCQKCGFEVVGALIPSGEEESALVEVLVEARWADLAERLAVHEWSPVVLGEAICPPEGDGS